MNMKLGLALAGGGVKGAAHVGVLKALEEENIEVDYIGGTSSGSIVASLYAMGFTADEIYKIFKKYCKKIKYVDFFNIIKAIFGLIFTGTIVIDGLNSGKQIEKLIDHMAHKKGIYNISEIEKNLVIPSVDMCNGEVICFTSIKNVDNNFLMRNRDYFSDKVKFVKEISIGKAVRASCSYPIVFSPCSYRDTKLIDGGIRENVPWKELKDIGAEKIISVTFEEKIDKSCCKNLIEVGGRAISLLSRELSNYEMEGADFNLKLKSEKVGLLDMSKIDELYMLGYSEMKKCLIRKNDLFINDY